MTNTIRLSAFLPVFVLVEFLRFLVVAPERQPGVLDTLDLRPATGEDADAHLAPWAVEVAEEKLRLLLAPPVAVERVEDWVAAAAWIRSTRTGKRVQLASARKRLKQHGVEWALPRALDGEVIPQRLLYQLGYGVVQGNAGPIH